ncbi:hypothetical protein [Nonomuraea roseoviolacea]|uniref:Uncharacterized protein n=1 Tax=Nonomuraea roseoviolacea subsp. carminata TaxID=160689 RepID=A0ABT1K9D1_9ACTN|nr:hypothetical protein [Nonomuraea roseoviolacea]MCP2350626.1 hypothetical protein [Nonomuraea roseoviolacea subsp. carminata]
MVRPALPVVLQIGGTTAEVGSVDLPLVEGPAVRNAGGTWEIEVRVDHSELRRRIADVLRLVADEFERGPADG